MSAKPGNVVIVGGGIIGCSIAYHLALRGVKSVVVERCGVACAASGKAGGFLARDWCDTYELGTLARRSFDMHASLGELFPDTGYRRVDTLSVSVNEKGQIKSLDAGKKVPDWVDGNIVGCNPMGTTKTTAQVHPYKLSHAMIEAAKDKVGTEVRKATVTGITKTSGDPKVTGVKLEGGETLPADVVVIAMGPWSGQASKWLGTPPVRGQKASSIVLKPESEVTPHALFLDFTHSNGRNESPEVYPRPDGTVYVCGGADKQNLPDDPGQVTVSNEYRDRLLHIAKTVSSSLEKAELQSAQACYLPVTSDSLPVIGAVPGVRGAYIAAGHSCWGILNAPATGAALADLIIDGTSHEIDISAFNPTRLM